MHGVVDFSGGVPERPKGTDCKSVGDAFGGSNPPPSTTDDDRDGMPLFLLGCSAGGQASVKKSGNSSIGRASAFQAEGRGFETRFPLQTASGKRREWQAADI